MKTPLADSSGVFWVEEDGFVCIFAYGENKGFAPSSRRKQGSTGALHFIVRILTSKQKQNS